MKRSKQKSGQSPKLGPSPRLRANSISSLTSSPSHTPEINPNPLSLEPSQMTLNHQTDALGTNGSGGYVQSGGAHLTTFRTLSASADGGEQRQFPALIPPRTGLGILMSSNGDATKGGNGVGTAVAPPPATHHVHQPPVHIAPNPFVSAEQQKMMRQDMIDRERQASALAAAGMVAEKVDSSHPATIVNPASTNTSAGAGVPISPRTELGLFDMGDTLSAAAIDQMETDFSRLFDPENEIQNMETEGSGWPTLNPNP